MEISPPRHRRERPKRSINLERYDRIVGHVKRLQRCDVRPMLVSEIVRSSNLSIVRLSSIFLSTFIMTQMLNFFVGHSRDLCSEMSITAASKIESFLTFRNANRFETSETRLSSLLSARRGAVESCYR